MTNSTTNVLVIIDTTRVSGPAKGLMQLIRNSTPQQIRYIVASFSYSEDAGEFGRAAREEGIDLFEIRQRHRLDFSFVAALAALIRSQRIDILQSHSFKPHIVAAWLRRTSAVAWVAFAHGWTKQTRRVRLYNFLERQLLRTADHLCTVTATLAEEFRAMNRRLPITVVSNAVEPSPPAARGKTADDVRKMLDIDAAAFVMVAIGRLSHEKGFDVLLKACHAVLGRGRQFQLLIAGEGPESEALLSLAEKLAIADRVHFMGYRKDTQPIYAAADLLVLSSRSEGVPNVVLEAVDSGVWVIATDVGAVRDVLRNHGAIVAAGDSLALADAICSAIDDRAQLPARAQAARREILPRFSPKARVATVMGVYGSVLAQRSAP